MAENAHSTLVPVGRVEPIHARRRSFFAAAAALALMAAAAPAFAKPSPDAELLAACAEALLTGAELDRLCEVECDADEAGDKAAEDAAYRASLALVPDYLAAVERAAALPAATAEGRQARAQVMLRRIQRRADGLPYGLEDRVLACLCADVLATA